MTERLTVHQAFLRQQVRSADAKRWESLFEWQVRALRLQGVHHPFTRWHPTRRFEFDFAHPETKVAVEIQGGSHGAAIHCNHCHRPVLRNVKGRMVPVREPLGHGTATGLRRDYEKLNLAQEFGWLLLQFDGGAVQDGTAAETFKRLIEVRTTILSPSH